MDGMTVGKRDSRSLATVPCVSTLSFAFAGGTGRVQDTQHPVTAGSRSSVLLNISGG